MSVKQYSWSSILKYEQAPHIYPEVDSFPDIKLNCNGFSHPMGYHSRENVTWQNVMMPVNEGVLRRIIRSYHEQGIKSALNEACTPQTVQEYPLIGQIAGIMLATFEKLELWKSKILPHTQEHNVNSLGKYCETRDWPHSYIRYIVWHPNCFKIAVASLNDIIRIYTDEPAIMPVLKYNKQKWITCMAWRPYTAAELAVGCQSGICFWSSLRTGAHPEFLAHPDRKPIISVQWNSDGFYLAAASIADRNILIWNVDNLQQAPIKRICGAPCSSLKWSPNGAHMFSSTTDNMFYIWFVHNKWKYHDWTIEPDEHIKVACWSPDSKFLLYSTSKGENIYCTPFPANFNSSSERQTVSVFIPTPEPKMTIDNREIGGKVNQLVWDYTGLYLAVSYSDTCCVVIFLTTCQHGVLTIAPYCYIAGNDVEYPAFICFKCMYRPTDDVVLTIGWSSGRIEYIPFEKL